MVGNDSNQYDAQNCKTRADNLVECSAPPGIGAYFNFRIDIGKQYNSFTLKEVYCKPEISSASTDPQSGLNTDGSGLVYVLGKNFGKIGSLQGHAAYRYNYDDT